MVTVNIAVDRLRRVLRRELIECGVMVGGLDDHLMPLRRRILVRKNPDAPRVAVTPDLRRRVRFVPGTKGAAVGAFAKNVRAFLPLRRDEQRVAGNRISSDHERSIRSASATRCPMPSSANAMSATDSHSATVAPPNRSAAQPLLQRMNETIGNTINARTNSPRPIDW